MNNPWQAGATDITLYWRACDTETGGDYTGTAIPANATGLTLGFIRNRSAATQAQVGAATEPVALASADAAHTPWGWRQVAGPFYRADFPNAMVEPGSAFVVPFVTGIDGVYFQRAAADDILDYDPRAELLTEPIDATVVGIDEAVLEAVALAVVDGAQTAGVALTPGQVTALTRSIFRALHYADGFGVRRAADDATAELVVPGEAEPVEINIDTVAGRPPVVAAGAAAS